MWISHWPTFRVDDRRSIQSIRSDETYGRRAYVCSLKRNEWESIWENPCTRSPMCCAWFAPDGHSMWMKQRKKNEKKMLHMCTGRIVSDRWSNGRLECVGFSACLVIWHRTERYTTQQWTISFAQQKFDSHFCGENFPRALLSNGAYSLERWSRVTNGNEPIDFEIWNLCTFCAANGVDWTTGSAGWMDIVCVVMGYSLRSLIGPLLLPRGICITNVVSTVHAFNLYNDLPASE